MEKFFNAHLRTGVDDGKYNGNNDEINYLFFDGLIKEMIFLDDHPHDMREQNTQHYTDGYKCIKIINFSN